MTGRKPKFKRNLEIKKLWDSGEWTLQRIGDKYGLTRQSIFCILNSKHVRELSTGKHLEHLSGK